MSITSEIERIKNNIANAYIKAEEKGATLPDILNSENLSDTIETIEQSSGEWKPQAEWWDIEKILEEDTEDYAGKMIAVLTDTSNTYGIDMRDGTKKIVFSDGGEYTSNGNHTWDRSKDKECSLGYKTRYVIRYYDNSVTAYRNMGLNDALYVIFQNMIIDVPTANIPSWSPVANAQNCEFIKFKDCLFSGSNFSFTNCTKLKGIDGYVAQDNVTMEYMYQNVGGMFDVPYIPKEPTSMVSAFNGSLFEYIPYIDTSKVTNFGNCFNLSRAIAIENLDFNSATNIGNMFNGAGTLVSINNVSNIKISGLNFNQATRLNHDTLIRILNALYDYSGSGSTYTLTLGSLNLAKLTDEELAIGQNKNWTIS